MKRLKDGFILRHMAGETVVIPCGGELDQNMMITLNDAGRLLWERLASGAEEDDLVAAMLEEYDVQEETARVHIQAFVHKLEQHGFLQ